MFHSVFSPSNMPLDTLQTTLVQREKMISRILEIFLNQSQRSSLHNLLLVGPRGIGKTHLVSLIYKRLKGDASFLKANCIAYLREDEWGITSYLDMLVRIADTLAAEAGAAPFSSAAALTAPSENTVIDFILRLLGDKTGLLIIENLDQLFSGIQADGQQRLRSFLQNFPRFGLLATAPSLFSAISRQTSPFYGFFEITYLKPLSVDDAVSLLYKLSSSKGDARTAEFVVKPVGRARVRAVQHLAGGNHRIFVLFYDFLSQNSTENILDPLLKTVDSLTPYYQSQMSRLSPQQQKIVIFLCRQRIPANVKTIASGCFITQQTAASQLKQLLAQRYVRVTRSGRESYYELAEPLLRICIEAKSHREGPLKILVEFLRFWFSPEELKQHTLSPHLESEMRYFSAALREYEDREGHEHLTPEIAELCISLDDPHRTLAETLNNAVELAELSKRAGDWTHYGRAMVRQGRGPEAAQYIRQNVDLSRADSECLYAFGRTLYHSDQHDEAADVFSRALSISPQRTDLRDLLVKSLIGAGRYAEAESNLEELQRNPECAREVSISKARILNEKGNHLEAQKLIAPHIEQNPKDDELLAWMAIFKEEAGNLDEAETLFLAAAEVAPNENYIRYNLARLKFKRQQYEEAIRLLDDSISAGMAESYFVGLRCRVLLALKQYAAAEECGPVEMVSHLVYRQLLNIYDRLRSQELITTELRALVDGSDTPRWREIYKGALIDFVRYAKDWDDPEDKQQLEKWFTACTELFANRDDCKLFLRIFEALLALKFSDNYKSLLNHPLCIF